MDRERKIQILEDADFTERKMQPLGKIGFGQLVASLNACVNMLCHSKLKGDKAQYWLQGFICTYNYLITYYDSIPFEEMDREDEDFKFLFEYRDMLDGAYESFVAFVDKCISNNFRGSAEWVEAQEAKLLIRELYDKMHHYRSKILKELGTTY